MNDFLGQLASRALEPGKTLKPRLLSAFEPAGPLPGPSLALFETGDSPEAGPTPGLATPSESSRPGPAQHPANAGQAGSTPDQPRRVERQERPQLRPASPQAPIAEPSGIDAKALPPQVPPAGQAREVSSSLRPHSTAEREKTEDTGSLRKPGPTMTPREVRPKPALEAPAAVKPSQASQHETGRHEARARPTHAPLDSILAGLRPKLTSHPARAESMQRAEAPHTIHVTIGRIEVRAAAQAPAPAVRRGRANSVLDLKEYLERRKGGPGR